MKHLAAALALATVLVLATDSAGGTNLTGIVTSVSDGDTFSVRLAGATGTTNVRLYSVDAPEKTQRDGPQARQFLTDLLLNRQVLIKKRGTSYERVLGTVTVDGRDVGVELAKAGMAWWYAIYAPESREVSAAEAEARANKRGIWAHSRVTPPWVFRDLQKAGKLLDYMRAMP